MVYYFYSIKGLMTYNFDLIQLYNLVNKIFFFMVVIMLLMLLDSTSTYIFSYSWTSFCAFTINICLKVLVKLSGGDLRVFLGESHI